MRADAVAVVVVARRAEDVGWLAQLPPGVDYHVVQKGGPPPPGLPPSKLTQLSDRGGAAHSYLHVLASVAREHEGVGRVREQPSPQQHSQHSQHPQHSSQPPQLSPRQQVGGSRSGGRVGGAPAQQRRAAPPGEGRAHTVQERIHQELRKQGARVQDLFRRWDCDRSNTVTRDEFRDALSALGIAGRHADYDALFDMWDVDGSGSLQYTELSRALSGARYDLLLDGHSAPYLPPLLIFAPADPLRVNARFLDDVAILVRLATLAAGASASGGPATKESARGTPTHGAFSHSQQVPAREAREAALPLPPFTPLGLARSGADGPSSTTPLATHMPSWARPEVHCDASGGPHESILLPIGALWRTLFSDRRARADVARADAARADAVQVGAAQVGAAQPGAALSETGPAQSPPLWIGFCPGNAFAITREVALQPEGCVGGEAASAFYGRAMCAGGLDQRREPLAGRAFERLWRHIFVGEREVRSMREYYRHRLDEIAAMQCCVDGGSGAPEDRGGPRRCDSTSGVLY